MKAHDAEAMLRQAANKLSSGDARTALLLSRQLMQAGHLGVPLWEIHAQAALQLGDLQSSINSIESAIQHGGATLERVLFYGDLLLRSKRWQAAADVFQQVIKQHDSNITAWLGVAHCLLGSGDVARASQAYSAVLERDPEQTDALLKLGACCLYLGDARQALPHLEKVRALKGDSADLAYYRGESLRRLGHHDEAIQVFLPYRDDPQCGSRIEKGLVMAWLSTDRVDQAIETLNRLLLSSPDDVELKSCKARWLSIEGRTEEAMELAMLVLKTNPDDPVIWELYSSLLDAPLPEEYLALLRSHQEKAAQNKEERSMAGLSFAAARHYNLADNPEEEMRQLIHGNALLAKLDPYDNVKHAENVRRVRESYSAAHLASLKIRDDDFTPVFLMCPPRSGSTLLEQALARHSAFHGQAAGEANFLGDAWFAMTGKRSSTSHPAVHENMSKEWVVRFADHYRAAIREAGFHDEGWLVHKGINNHKVAGLLKAAFPNARFIDLRRDPMDVAFGCFRQNFETQPFSFTMEGCAMELALFQADIGWWREQMPDAIHQVRYQDLVEDFEGTLRPLLAWLGLEWEEGCLDFKRKSRVLTASVNQVRQGLFKQGVGRWRKYEPWLDELKQAMAAQGVYMDGDG